MILAFGIFCLIAAFISYGHVSAFAFWFELIIGVIFTVSQLIPHQEQESCMNEIVAIETKLNNVLWKLKGSTSHHGHVSKPQGNYLKNLQAEKNKLEKEIDEFWKTHKYSDGNQGMIIKK